MPDRLFERAEIKRLLASGRSLQMLAPRRVGKTWLMHKVEEDLSREGWVTVFVDVEGMHSGDELLKALCGRIEAVGSIKQGVVKHLTHRLKQLAIGGWDGGNPLTAIGRVDTKQFCEELIAALNAQGRECVILIDEIALFVMRRVAQDAAATLDFLYHLRKLRQGYPKVRWFLTGSIGLDVVARRNALTGALVDLEILPLEPFGPAAAREYLERRCRAGQTRQPFALGNAAFEALARGLGWLAPFYLDLIADRIVPTGEPGLQGRPRATAADVERAFDEMLKPPYRGLFSTWEDHIGKNFQEPDRGNLFAILEVFCEQPDGETFATLQARLGAKRKSLSVRELKDLLKVLANDGFLHEAGDRWRFRSGLLRRYWLEYWHE